ncbi:Aste57867_17776 [Aphanomyces stellatus]|uniref:Aste57867_17776 protein n=1 Tax=Aphanomyces stellatus TaxID=120398 RepID=A0A485L8I5_9STRA|nr:hypothetical protein As57867_017715 [Aphanomyces stellatus]VFT94521.1 Aste57867_17776 [Aphanomyces stellatus]
MIRPAQPSITTRVDAPPMSHPFRRRLDRLVTVAGVGYLALTLACGMSYLSWLQPSLANNLYWPYFNTTGVGGCLIDLVNVRLTTTRLGPMDLLADDVAMHKRYDGVVQPEFNAAYPRRILFTELNTLPRAIRDLRRTDIPYWVYAQYCWVDLARRWDMAHTAARSTRCQQRYIDNAANYLETLLRNVAWDDFYVGNEDMWHVSIALALQASVDGRDWLAARPVVARQLSVDDEVAFLVARNLTRYDLLWQNEVVVAISESMVVVNALGVPVSMTTKSLAHPWGPLTSFAFYWNLYSDMYFGLVSNASLVRSAENHFDAIGLPIEAMMGLQDTTGDYVQQPKVFLDSLGPFGSVDALYVAVPSTLTRAYEAVRGVVYQTLWSNPAFAKAFQRIPHITLAPTPPAFSSRDNLAYYGGNLVCFANAATTFPQSQLSFSDTCATETQFGVPATNLAVVFALWASQTAHVGAICALQSADGCSVVLSQAQVALGLLNNPPDARAMVNPDVVPAIQVVQYAQDASSGEWLLLQQPLVSSDQPNWSFYGWLALFDWVEGRREVLRLEGDVATIDVITEAYATVHFMAGSDDDEGQRDTNIVYYLMAYTTAVSTVVGVVVMTYTVAAALDVDGGNLFVFNRVAGCVWVGRPLLVLRALTATLVLSSSQVQLITQPSIDGYSKFVAAPRPVVATMVIVGEATWATYVATDVLLVLLPWRVSTKWMAAVASALAWATLFGFDMAHPVGITIALDRTCSVKNTDKQLICNAGYIQVGDSTRFALCVALQGACVAVALVVAWMCGGKTKRPHQPTTLLLPGAAEAFLYQRGAIDPQCWHVDRAACIMCGLLSWSWRGQQYTFDVKLWVVVDNIFCPRPDDGGSSFSFKKPTLGVHKEIHSTMLTPVVIQVVSKQPMRTPAPLIKRVASTTTAMHLHGAERRLVVVAGLVYMVLSAIGSLSYISVSTVNFANNFFWVSFNMTGSHVAMADWIIENVVLGRALPAFRWDEPRWSTMYTNFSDPTLPVVFAPRLAPRVQFERVATTLAVVVQGLRRTDACAIPWIFTQYCWVDFGRHWPLANSQARQARCESYVHNGAIYLESALRNMDWALWAPCWGNSFDVAIGNELRTTQAGQRWLATTQSNLPATVTINEEVSVWTAHGIDAYTVQWHNFKTTGLVHTYWIENAFGVQYPMTLSRTNGSYAFEAQTMFQMYWGVASDFWAVGSNASAVAGQSLIRSSAAYAFANVSIAAAMRQNRTLPTPLGAVFATVQTYLGPFGSIDMYNMPCPATLTTFVATGLDVVRAATVVASSNVTATYAALAYVYAGVLKRPLPTVYLNSPWTTVTGSLLCDQVGNAFVSTGLLDLMSRANPCGSDFAMAMGNMLDSLLLAAIATGLDQASDAIDSICQHDVASPTICLDVYLGPAAAFLPTFLASRDMTMLQGLADAARHAMRALPVSLVQLIRATDMAPLELQAIDLFDEADPTFEFWSWLLALEWVAGNREVVVFQGDAGRLHVLTDFTSMASQAVRPSDLPTAFAMYARAAVLYVTGAMLTIVLSLILYIVGCRGAVDGARLWSVNQVAGIVWVGRPLLLARGLTALAFLATASLELAHTTTQISLFTVPGVPYVTTILSGGEATWVVYILQDILLPWTAHQWTLWSSMYALYLVWACVAGLTLVYPVNHTASIAPVCEIDQMDFQLHCVSGVVAIGHVSRLYLLLAAIGGCNALSYAVVFAVMRRRHAQRAMPESVLLSAGAKYLFDWSEWMHHGVPYMDPAAAFLNGLVTFRRRGVVYALDIKLWRVILIEVDDDDDASHAFAFPLTD